MPNAEIRQLRVNYHGGGYVGLTGAVHYWKAGFAVVITDPDRSVVDAINAGTPKAGSFLRYTDMPPIDDRFRAQVGIDTDADVHIIAVPSEKNGEPFMSIVLDLFEHLDLVVYPYIPIIVESTVMPGVAKQLRAITTNASTPTRRPWAIAPRRDWFADKDKNLSTLTRVVGLDPQHSLAIRSWIAPVCRDVQWTTPETAEVTKALENALLHLPVVLIHELAMLYPDYDIAEAARLASSHWRFHSMGQLYMGLGTGGRCVPLGSRYLNQRGGALLADAIQIDDDYAFSAIAHLIANVWDPNGTAEGAFGLRMRMHSKHVAVLGVSYRPGFKDAGHSPGLRAIDAVAEFFGTITVVDPFFTDAEIYRLIEAFPPRGRETIGGKFRQSSSPAIFDSRPARPASLHDADLVIITVGHEEFKQMGLTALGLLKEGAVVLDAAGAWENAVEAFPEPRKFRYVRPGRPGWLRV